MTSAPPEALSPLLERYLEQLRAIRREAAGLDLRRTRVVSPVTRLVRMNVGDALALLLTHERRHLGQIGRVRESAGFPAA
jgi:hypothetical protein